MHNHARLKAGATLGATLNFWTNNTTFLGSSAAAGMDCRKLARAFRTGALQ